jgi:hypothetical protein
MDIENLREWQRQIEDKGLGGETDEQSKHGDILTVQIEIAIQLTVLNATMTRIAEALEPISHYHELMGQEAAKLEVTIRALRKTESEPDPPLKAENETIPFQVGEIVTIYNPECNDYHSKDDCFYWERYKRYEGRTDSIDSFEFPNIPHLKLADICVPVDWLMHVSGAQPK